jgi:phosphate starvation-inducible protein PhoH
MKSRRKNKKAKPSDLRKKEVSQNSSKPDYYSPIKDFKPKLKPKTENQANLIRTIAENTVILALGPAGTGKALTLNSKLFTKYGSITMRDVKIGDEIANPDGGFSKVTGVYPQGIKRAHRVFFSNGCYVDCCEEHLWKVKHRDNGWNRVVDTKFLKNNCRKHNGKRLLSIDCSKPVSFERKEYIIDPYFMGIIISEGGLTNSSLCFTSCEKEVLQRVEAGIIDEYLCVSSSYKDHRLVKAKRSCKKNIYIEELRKLDLWGKYSYQKHIPDTYKYGSVDQRIALLQGLMDGDGTVSKEGSISYCTTSFSLIKDFCDLVYSLGGTTKIKEKTGSLKNDGTRHRKSYRCHINLPNDIEIFFLSRKKKRVVSRKKYFPKLYVDRVEELGEQEMQCISVDHKDSLYLTDNYIPTHNTKLSVAYGVEKLLMGDYKRLIITRPVVEAGENLGFLPGSFSEKLDPYLQPIYYELMQYLSKQQLQTFINNGINHRGIEEIIIAPLAYMRGMNYHDSYMILDEAQNCTAQQIKLFITRVGFNSKAILVGDDKQSDLPSGKSGLIYWHEKLQDIESVGTYKLQNADIIRNPVISRILSKIGE